MFVCLFVCLLRVGSKAKAVHVSLIVFLNPALVLISGQKFGTMHRDGKTTAYIHIYIPGQSKGCQVDGKKVPLSNALGFKHHPLKGANIHNQQKKKSTLHLFFWDSLMKKCHHKRRVLSPHLWLVPFVWNQLEPASSGKKSKFGATKIWNHFGSNKMKGNGQYMGVSKNMGTPKSSILIGVSIINHSSWGTPIFGNIHMYCTNRDYSFCMIKMNQAFTRNILIHFV